MIENIFKGLHVLNCPEQYNTTREEVQKTFDKLVQISLRTSKLFDSEDKFLGNCDDIEYIYNGWNEMMSIEYIKEILKGTNVETLVEHVNKVYADMKCDSTDDKLKNYVRPSLKCTVEEARYCEKVVDCYMNDCVLPYVDMNEDTVSKIRGSFIDFLSYIVINGRPYVGNQDA